MTVDPSKSQKGAHLTWSVVKRYRAWGRVPSVYIWMTLCRKFCSPPTPSTWEDLGRGWNVKEMRTEGWNNRKDGMGW